MNPIAAWFRISLPKRALIVLGPPALLFFVVFVAMFVISAPKRQLWSGYGQLKLGQTQAQVESLLGHRPDYRCTFADSEIWYVASHDLGCGSLDTQAFPPGARYQELSDLPDVYDHVQLAFDRHGNLHAYTWIGEEMNVTAKSGTVLGSHFSALPEDSF